MGEFLGIRLLHASEQLRQALLHPFGYLLAPHHRNTFGAIRINQEEAASLLFACAADRSAKGGARSGKAGKVPSC
jgi:hypothetical protein